LVEEDDDEGSGDADEGYDDENDSSIG